MNPGHWTNEGSNVARGLLSWDLLEYKPRDELGPDDRELFEQLIQVELKLEQAREFLRMLPGRQNNPELLEGCRRFGGLMEEKLFILEELCRVPLDIDPAMYVMSRVCWEVNACTVVAAKRY